MFEIHSVGHVNRLLNKINWLLRGKPKLEIWV